MKRLKKVFSNSYKVAHIWAQRTQIEGRCSNCFFEGDTIYSYGHHFPMARFHGKNAVLITTKTYSKTTSKHISEVKHSIRGEYTRFHVDNVKALHHKEDHEKNIIEGLKECDRLYTLAAKAVKKTDVYFNQAEQIKEGLKAYSKFFKVGYRFKPAPDLKLIKDKLNKQAAATKARKAAELQEKIDLQNKFLSEILPLWRKNKPYILDGVKKDISPGFRLFDHDFLRIEKQNKNTVIVGTSKEVKLPIKHGGELLPYVNRLLQDCRDCINNNKSLYSFDYQLGEYRINNIDNTGRVKVGCHTIPFSEIELVLNSIK